MILLPTVEEYDPVKDKWEKRADMPTRRNDLSTSAVNGKIYAIGGGCWDGNSTVEEYDPATDTWTEKAHMPTARWGLSTSVVDGKIYAIGGGRGTWPNVVSFSTVEVYDPAQDIWTKRSDMPTARCYLSTSSIDGKIYAIGGFSGLGGNWGPLSVVEEYDPATDTWTKKEDMPDPRGVAAASVVNGQIYSIGGAINFRSALPTVEIYDPVADRWKKGADMPTARRWLSASEVNGRIYAIGGSTASNAVLATVEEYTPYAWKR
jgi:N-acetylneuraminic acid mutarotase